jgi:CBS domain-containing protein
MSKSTHQYTQRVPLRAKDAMTPEPLFAIPGTPVQAVAEMMVREDCGSIPIVESSENQNLIGIVTDRDITCRSIAKGKNPLEMTARDVMTSPVVSVSPEATLEECSDLMAEYQIRRLPVVQQRRLRGLVTQAHLAKMEEKSKVGHMVWQISQHRQPAMH